jgi:hypothetical protein
LLISIAVFIDSFNIYLFEYYFFLKNKK